MDLLDGGQDGGAGEVRTLSNLGVGGGGGCQLSYQIHYFSLENYNPYHQGMHLDPARGSGFPPQN